MRLKKNEFIRTLKVEEVDNIGTCTVDCNTMTIKVPKQLSKEDKRI